MAGPNAGDRDAFLARFDAEGNQVWARQFGSSQGDEATSLAPDGAGGVFISGWTRGGLMGPSAGGADAWLARFDSAGNLTWARQFGTDQDDYANSVAFDGAGRVFVSGWTAGDLGGPNMGGFDAFIARFPASACYPDCNGDGVLDFLDFLCFQNAFLAQDSYADCDRNNTFDFFDFLCYQNAFLAGCP
jgi:hypothetical protein